MICMSKTIFISDDQYYNTVITLVAMAMPLATHIDRYVGRGMILLLSKIIVVNQ